MIRAVNLSCAVLTARKAQILLQRARDENDIRGLVDSAVAHVIFGAGSDGGPRLDDHCQCETVKKGIASTYIGLLKGPGGAWQWPVSLETDSPFEVLSKLQEWKIEVEASDRQCPCAHPGSGSGSKEDVADSSCMCCKPDLFVRLQDEIRTKAEELLDRMGEFDYDFDRDCIHDFDTDEFIPISGE